RRRGGGGDRPGRRALAARGTEGDRMTRRRTARRPFSRPQWAISIAIALAVIGFIGAAQWNSSVARQEFVTSAQRVLVLEAEQAQREQEELRAQIEEAEARILQFQEQEAGSRTAEERLNQQVAMARLAAGLTRVTGPGVVIEIADSPVRINDSKYL